MKDKFYIGELSKKLNISKRTILYYEDIGLISSVRESVSNYRLYDKEQITKLEQIILFKKINLPLNEIYKIITLKDSEYAVSAFQKRLNKINNEISNLYYSKNILQSFINITNKKGVGNIDVIQLLTELTCVDKSYERIIGLSNLYEINLEIHISENLIPIANIKSGGILLNRIKQLRESIRIEESIVLPLIRVCDVKEFGKDEYAIKLQNCIVIREKIDASQIEHEQDKCSVIVDSLKKVISNNTELFEADGRKE